MCRFESCPRYFFKRRAWSGERKVGIFQPTFKNHPSSIFRELPRTQHLSVLQYSPLGLIPGKQIAILLEACQHLLFVALQTWNYSCLGGSVSCSLVLDYEEQASCVKICDLWPWKLRNQRLQSFIRAIINQNFCSGIF